MINIFRGYVRTKDKTPTQKFKGEAKLLSLEEANKYEEYAGILNNDFVVMDVDDSDEAERTFELVKAMGLNCRVVKTTRGKHFIFKKNPSLPLKGQVKQINALGFTFDIRIGVNQYIVVKTNGKLRVVEQEFKEDEPVSVYPTMFKPLPTKNKFTGMGDGDGRNGKLFGHISTLIHAGFTKEETIQIIHYINDYYLLDPMSDHEIDTICRDDAFTGLTVVAPEEAFINLTYKPSSFSDLDMAELFANHYKNEVRYNPGTDYLVWNGKVWEMSYLKASKKYFKFLKKVVAEAKKEIALSYDGSGDEDKIKEAKKFYAFALKMCDANKIANVLKLARSFLEIKINELDSNPFYLNTPDGIIDLKSGELLPHDPNQFCTKMTSVSKNANGEKKWLDLLALLTKNDAKYTYFLKVLCGGAVIGRVYNEALIIAHGEGHNGKSTIFNSIFKVIGDYAGKIPAESLTTKAKNTKVDLAELYGKRFILASETEEGNRLSNQMLKQIASTDAITGEKKYKDPIVFEPSHTVLLYTNFLPKIGSLDEGTKRRIIICPFNAVIANPQKDYAEQLIKDSGGAILKWLIEGAKDFIDAGYKLPEVEVVTLAKKEYISDNDWIQRFINDCCIVGELEKQAVGVLYKAYQIWAKENGEFPKRNSDFSQALNMAGFPTKRTNKCVEASGLSLDPETLKKQNPFL